MQQILNFLFKNSYKLLFLLLVFIGLFLTIQGHSFHRGSYVNSANFLSGNFYTATRTITDYFSLKEQNTLLHTENEQLRKLLFNKTTTAEVKNSIKHNKKAVFKVKKARIIKNEYSKKENYLTLNIGKKDSIATDMGVINDKGIVGIIEKTSTHFSTVLSVLNTKSKINAKVKNTSYFGSLLWNAKNSEFVQLIDVPRLGFLKKGDSIVTGAQSHIFPEDIPIGTIHKIYTDTKTNVYTIQVKLFNNMKALNYVYVIKNSLKTEKDSLELETKTNN